MKSIKSKFIALGMAVAMTVTVAGVMPTEQVSAKAKVNSIVLNRKTATVYVGQEKSIKLFHVNGAKPTSSNKAVTYKIANKKIATVSKKGIVKGVSKGKTTVTVTSKYNKKASAKVTVKVTANQQKINDATKNNPYITQEELADIIGITKKSITANMKKLQDSGLIKRIGANKNGHWQITE